MAALGVAASGIGIASLAIQVGDSILKLKSFWEAVKEAPEDIKHLIDEIEILSLVLSEIGKESDEGEEPPIASALASKCQELCRGGLGALQDVVHELGSEMKKRKRVGSVKAVLKKETVDKLKDRLRSAQLLLMLSNITYTK
jgi:hypothetical protein